MGFVGWGYSVLELVLLMAYVLENIKNLCLDIPRLNLISKIISQIINKDMQYEEYT